MQNRYPGRPLAPAMTTAAFLAACSLAAAGSFAAPAGRPFPSAGRAAPAAVDADLRDLLDGVGGIAAPGGLAATFTLLGGDAFPAVLGKQGRDGLAPVVAAARGGKGRIVAFGHGNFLSGEGVKRPGNARLLTNVVRWAAGGKAAPRVAVVGPTDTADALRAAGFAVTQIARPEGITPDALRGVDVLFAGMGVFDGGAGKPRVAAVDAFVRAGGGLVTSAVGWGWQQLNPGLSLSEDFGLNRLLVPLCGLGCDSGTADPTGKDGAFPAPTTPAPYLSAGAALARLESGTPLGKDEVGGVARAVSAALDVLPANDRTFLPRLNRLMAKAGAASVVPTKQDPLTLEKPLARIGAVLESRRLDRLAPEKVTAHPAAANFPGAVPADAPRLSAARTVEIDTSVPDWHSTGLYAAPGEVVTVTLPASAARKGLGVRIGAHRDTLWHLEKWWRFPDVTQETRLNDATVRVASPFGGTVFVTVPRGAKLGKVPVAFSGGVVEQPYFVRGKTTAQEWERLRDAPGPWAELVGKRIALTVPSSVVRGLKDPAALMDYWDAVGDAACDLYGISRERDRPERYCVDVQISAGYMHSGYPIMTHDDVAARFVDLAELRKPGGGNGTWGFYHELGHNHQRREWTWSGCGEVTNNLFSLYGGEKFNGVPADASTTHGALEPGKRRERLVKHLAAGAPYQEWQSDPWLALTLFHGLRVGFGWEPFQKVFADYERLPDSERPKTDDEKRDQFLVRFSRAVGKDLGPYFTAFGVPTSEAARASLSGLPRWMPGDWPAEQEVAAARAKVTSR